MGEIVRVREKNELIKRRKHKRKLKKAVIFIIFLISLFFTLLFKAPYFNVTNIEVVNNKIMSKEEIIKNSGIELGKNIFHINKKIYINSIKTNPYALNVEIKRKLPSTLLIKIQERVPKYYIQVGDSFYILDNESKLLEVNKELANNELIKLEGLDLPSTNLGDSLLPNDDRRLQWLEEYAKLIKYNTSDIEFTSIDLNDTLNVKLYYHNIKVIIGTLDDLKTKLNKAINILSYENIKDSKGYIDISFNGNPVVYIEK